MAGYLPVVVGEGKLPEGLFTRCQFDSSWITNWPAATGQTVGLAIAVHTVPAIG
jgi:hypothetical protein